MENVYEGCLWSGAVTFRQCKVCKQRDSSVAYSNQMQAFVCDGCFTDYNDEREQANIDAAHSNGEQND